MDELLFLELAGFRKWVRKHRLDAAVEQLKLEITANPDAGDVIPSGGGLRKVRMAGGGRGKRSGYRVVYVLMVERTVAGLMAGYAKNEKKDLTAGELASLVAEIAPLERMAREAVDESRSSQPEGNDGE